MECDVAICVVNTFRGKELAFLRDNGFGLVIFDEAHEYYTKMNSNALWLAQGAEFVLGLSATPLERKDGLDTFVTHFLGKPVLQESIPGFDVEQGAFPGAVTKITYECDIEYADHEAHESGTPCNASTLSLVLSDPDRMILVARETMRLFEEGHGIFVFSEFREYLMQLRDTLAELGLEETDITIEDDEDAQTPDAQAPPARTSSVPLAVLRGGVRSEYLEQVRKRGARGAHHVWVLASRRQSPAHDGHCARESST